MKKLQILKEGEKVMLGDFIYIVVYFEDTGTYDLRQWGADENGEYYTEITESHPRTVYL